MVKFLNYIVTTRIKKSWPTKKKNSVFFPSIEPLIKYPQKNFPYKKFYICENLWKNNSSLLKKFYYLNSLYEKLLINFTSYLNLKHNTNYSIDFWRILLGPWLQIYLFISFDKWKKISTTIKNFSINKFKKLVFDKNILIPYDMQEFISFTQNDLWHQSINQDICKEILKEKNSEQIDFSIKNINKYIDISKTPKEKLSFFKKFLFTILRFKNTRNYKYLIFRPYIGAFYEFLLSIRLKQLPIYDLGKKNNISSKIDSKNRIKLDEIFVPKNKFEKYILKSFKHHLPNIFLENYFDLLIFSEKSNIPKNPKKIFSANALWYDSFFSYHAAKLKENGSKIIYAQHGGSYGIAKYSCYEKHEKKISNKYLTWGWSDKQSNKNIVKKFFILIKNKKYNFDKNKKKLLILLKHRKIYLQSPDSFAACENHSNYLSFLTPFLNNLKKEIKNNIVLRLTYKNFQSNNFEFFRNLKKKYMFSNISFQEDINNARLIINTCNSTTFLETLSSNIPSILVINNKRNPIRKDAFNIFKILVKNNLVFYNTADASNFINEIWSYDIRKWWHQKKIQDAVISFQNNYARPSKNIIQDIKNELIN